MKPTLILLIIILSASMQVIYAQEVFPVDTFMYSPHYYTDVEEAKKDPENVWYLDLNLQKHKQFPFEICRMIHLKRLDVSFNHFPMIPTLISNLQQLEWLDISGNYYLNSLPDSFGKLQNLKELRVKDNRLKKGELEKLKNLLPNCKIMY